MPMRHAARRLEEDFEATLAECPLWMIDAPHATGLRHQISAEQIAAAIGGPVQAPGNLTIVNGVAVIPVTGMIVTRESWMTREGYATSQQAVQRQYEAALGSDQVRGIAFYIDSPGGYAQGNEEAAQAMFAAKGKKPSVAYVEGMMCSAAYYLGSVADKIVASPSSLVGSIGSILVHFEVTKYLEDIGFTATVIRNPQKKALGGMFEPLGEAGRASWQAKIDQLTGMFEAAVARQRGVSAAQVREKYGQGEAFFAAQALERGLIDQVGSWGDALAALGQSRKSTVSQSLEAGNAGAMPGSSTSVSPPIVPSLESRSMNPQLKAALFARGLISSMEASDTECAIALRSFYAGRGETLPTNGDKIDEAKALAGLNALAASVSPNPTAGAQPAGAAANNVQAAHDREVAEAKAEAVANYKARDKSLRARAAILGITDEATIAAGVESAKSEAEVIHAWTDKLVAANTPITPVAGGHGGENFMADAIDGLTVRAFEANPNRCPVAADRRSRREVLALSRASLLQIAAQCLSMSGQRVDPYADREETAARAMASDGYERHSFGANDVPAARPGSFPNILSALANKFMNEGLLLAEPTYQEWTGTLQGDLPDFKPVPIMGVAGAEEMQEVMDAEVFKEVSITEELAGMMQLKRYGRRFGLTPVMIANDDMGVFTEKTVNLGMGWEFTVNRLCLAIITGNVTLLDGNALYDDTNHHNDVASGGTAPTDAEFDVHQLKLAGMRGINNEGYLRHRLDRILIPDQLWRGSVQAFGAPAGWIDIKQSGKTTDSTMNVYRGMVMIIREPELQATSTKIWYSFCNPAVAPAVKRAYFRGFPKAGKRERYYDPRTKCTWFDLEGRVGAAPVQYRNTVRDKGEA